MQSEQQSSTLMTEGSIGKKIIFFSIPLILGNLLQQLYSTADSIIVGNFVGSNALAAVGSSTALIGLLIAFSQGVSVGAGVVAAQYLGAKNRRDVQGSIHTAFALAAVLGIILTAVLLGLINKSFYKWTLFSGIAAVISGIVVGLFMPLVVSAMEFTIGNRLLGMSIDIPVGSLRLDGAICAGAGIILIVAYIILNKKYATFERHYY